MNIDHLTLLLDVTRRGSFASAAKEQALDPSSVSRVIAKLEEELGFRIFQRSTRRLSLTEAGQVFVKRVEAIVEEFSRARSEALDATDMVGGTLRLTASVAFGQICILPLLPAFRARYPALKLDLLFTDANLDLVAERIDLAVRLAPALHGDLIAVKLADMGYSVVATPDYVERNGKPGAPQDLARHSCVLLDLDGLRATWRFRDGRTKDSVVDVSGEVTVSNPLALLGAARAGLGPALLADWMMVDLLKRGELVDLFPAHAVTASTFDTAAWIVYPSRVFLPRKVRVMIDFLKEMVGGKGFAARST